MESIYVRENIKVGNREITLAAFNKEELEKVVKNFNCMLKEAGLICVDEQDIITLFYQKGTVFTGCIKVLAGKSLEEAAMVLFSEMQKAVSHMVTNVLIMVTGNVTLMDAAETGSIIQQELGENANIAISFYEEVNYEEVYKGREADIMIAMV